MKVSVMVHPNSKKPRIEKDLLGTLQIYVSEPPMDGRANMAVIEVLAKFFKTKKSKIQLLRGTKSKKKAFEIEES